MNEERYTKRDWKLFQEKLPGWQEAYMDKLNQGYIKILCGEGNPSDRFWQLEKTIKEDKKKAGVRLQISRTDLIYDLLQLMREGVIAMADIEEFSDGLKETLSSLTADWC